MSGKKLRSAEFVIRVSVASYDEIPNEDEIVDSLCEGISGAFVNTTLEVEVERKETGDGK